ncbi:GtrA family protein [Mesorhizobium sp. NBSH29]|uniref:GtrA family protein n=1 Tax=Mesorhizobium sp. NBSH29 TaxID=2654249 RepID=UPI001896496E|nr:GtrA family protein [Mesorhizobium sp. NBSH29]QPC87911.1 GtrA family protein [Mesorhizobium sp. NBSH29]
MASRHQPSELSLLTKIARFGIVGVANSIIDLSVFSLLWKMLAIPALAANGIGWLAAICFSYVVNSRWSFERDKALGDRRSVVRFFMLGALITLCVSSLALVALSPLIGTFPAKIAGLIVAAIFNFLAARWAIEDRIR